MVKEELEKIKAGRSPLNFFSLSEKKSVEAQINQLELEINILSLENEQVCS